jgi:hypothetical protein
MNRHRPHLRILPEDDATRSLAVGFNDRAAGPIEVLKPVRGWLHVLERFEADHLPYLRKYPAAHLVLLVDFDDDFPARAAYCQTKIPADVADRVFVLGPSTEAESLKKELGLKLGKIGENLAAECIDGSSQTWNCRQLAHNAGAVAQLVNCVKPFVFNLWR